MSLLLSIAVTASGISAVIVIISAVTVIIVTITSIFFHSNQIHGYIVVRP